MTYKAILSLYLYLSMPMCLYAMVIDHIEGGLAPILLSRVVHRRASAGLLLSYPAISLALHITVIPMKTLHFPTPN